MKRAILLVAAMTGMAAPVWAEEGGRAADRVLAPFLSCRQNRDVAARAACYDAALDTLQGQVGARQVVIVDHDQAVQDRRTLFGFGADHGAQPPRPVKPARPVATARAAKPVSEELNEIDSTVASSQPYGYDQWVIRLATGAVWRTTESGLPIQPKPGAKVHIHRGVMNGYLLRVGSSRAVRAMRVG